MQTSLPSRTQTAWAPVEGSQEGGGAVDRDTLYGNSTVSSPTITSEKPLNCVKTISCQRGFIQGIV